MAETGLPENLDPRSTALFFDCDGTLSDIVAHPADARVEPWLRDRIGLLAGLTGGALAIVSGRSIAQLDGLFAPLTLAAAGVHGAERRDAEGRLHEAAGAAAVDEATRRVGHFARSRPGLVCEPKPGAVALHYRMQPDMHRAVEAFASELAASRPELSLRYGKLVVEIVASDRTKGDAIAAFMDEPPFAGRMPFFVGDDVTDEDGFAVVEAMGGIAAKIGEGSTSASVRLPHRHALESWLCRLGARWGEGTEPAGR